MILFGSGSCLGKLERVKANSLEAANIINHYHIPTVQPKSIGPVRFYALLFASFICLWRDPADPNEIVRRRKRNVILRNAINWRKIFFKKTLQPLKRQKADPVRICLNKSDRPISHQTLLSFSFPKCRYYIGAL